MYSYFHLLDCWIVWLQFDYIIDWRCHLFWQKDKDVIWILWSKQPQSLQRMPLSTEDKSISVTHRVPLLYLVLQSPFSGLWFHQNTEEPRFWSPGIVYFTASQKHAVTAGDPRLGHDTVSFDLGGRKQLGRRWIGKSRNESEEASKNTLLSWMYHVPLWGFDFDYARTI